MMTSKFSDFFTPFPPCHIQKSADFVPFVCFLGTPSPLECRRHKWKPPNVKTRKPSLHCSIALAAAVTVVAVLADVAGGQQQQGQQGGAAADVLGCSLEVVVDPSLYSHLRDNRFGCVLSLEQS